MEGPAHPFLVGEVYNRRRDIHGPFGGQERGGIATPTSVPLIFAFTSEAGAEFGYEDSFRPDGTFWYTGEGQVGNMEWVRGNAAIAGHAERGKSILLFESTPDEQVRFLGEVEYLGHHKEQRPDRNQTLRNAIVFHLGFLPPVAAANAKSAPETKEASRHLSSKLSLAELRAIATEAARPGATLEQKSVSLARRAEAIRRYALKRAQGICEACDQGAPFKAKSGPFLEVHHVFRLADGGPDHPAHVIALCPNCHRRAHYALDAQQFNERLVAWLADRE